MVLFRYVTLECRKRDVWLYIRMNDISNFNVFNNFQIVFCHLWQIVTSSWSGLSPYGISFCINQIFVFRDYALQSGKWVITELSPHCNPGYWNRLAFIKSRGPSWPWSYGSWIYNYICNPSLSSLMLWVRIAIRARCTTSCNDVCQWLATGRWFSPGPPGSCTNKTDRQDIPEILLKVALNIITLTFKQTNKQFI